MSAPCIERASRSDREPMPGMVVTCTLASDVDPDGHDARTRSGIAQRLAQLKGFDFGGEFDARRDYATSLYFVPSDALPLPQATRLGIVDEDDLFGGVVTHPFAATKAITHPLLDRSAFAPPAWADAFPHAVAGSVLQGFTVFARDDLRRAVERQLQRGPARVKRTLGIGGSGQFVVSSTSEIDAVLDEIADSELSTVGTVVEENLECVTTFSVGQVRVAGLVASYHGTQRLTVNNRGNEVYGGSRLRVVRGGFDALLAAPLSEAVRVAVTQARAYDAAAQALLPRFFASRRNYDVMQGTDAAGRPKSGVLEQSWRMGGASGAEVAALEAFKADAALHEVQASTIEIYGESPPPPADATVYFRDVDSRVGFITKYSRLETT